jgi:hypothetical protein
MKFKLKNYYGKKESKKSCKEDKKDKESKEIKKKITFLKPFTLGERFFLFIFML